MTTERLPIAWEALSDRQRDELIAQCMFGHVTVWRPWKVAQNVFYRTPDGWTLVPRYTSDPTAALRLEDWIERKGKEYPYIEELGGLVGIEDRNPSTRQDLWDIIRATPEQRCRAALRAIGVDV